MFQERSFLWEGGASVGEKFELFRTEGKEKKHTKSPLSCKIMDVSTTKMLSVSVKMNSLCYVFHKHHRVLSCDASPAADGAES